MASKVKVVKIIKTGRNSYEVIYKNAQWVNINKYQVIGRLADIIESELGKYNIIIIPE